MFSNTVAAYALVGMVVIMVVGSLLTLLLPVIDSFEPLTKLMGGG